jgi:hypothetical protein
MKQYFTHRLPSHVTLLNDPRPEESSEAREKVNLLMKTAALSLALKSSRRKSPSGPVSS